MAGILTLSTNSDCLPNDHLMSRWTQKLTSVTLMYRIYNVAYSCRYSPGFSPDSLKRKCFFYTPLPNSGAKLHFFYDMCKLSSFFSIFRLYKFPHSQYQNHFSFILFFPHLQKIDMSYPSTNTNLSKKQQNIW